MRDDDEACSGPALNFLQLKLRFFAQLAVERAERLVEQKQPGTRRERARKSDALSLPARKLVNAPRAMGRELRHFEKLRDAASNRGGGLALSPQSEGDILENIEMREKRIGLEHHVDWSLMRRRAGQVFSVQREPARVRRLETGDAAHEGGLAAARRAEQREEFSRADIERHIVQRDRRAESFRNMFDCEQRRVHASGSLALGSRAFSTHRPLASC